MLFRGLIGLIHNLLFLGRFSVVYDANAHTPQSPWGVLVILVPVAGAAVVAFLVSHYAPEAKGHGVPEVMDAIYYRAGAIRPVVALIKSLASAVSIGSGGSVGREGPIIQIGASFGSTLAQLLALPPWQRIVLIGCGAGGGIAATFNTPVGGILFVLELMLHEVSARTIVPVAIATATATWVGRIAFGAYPSFVIPAMQVPYFHSAQPFALAAYVGLGLLMGLASVLFIRSIYGSEDFFEKRVGGSYYHQHLLGMFVVGMMIYAMMSSFGHYYIEGVGYATVQDILSDAHLPLYLMLLLFAMKLLATSLTLGSGASGGIFSPALFMGATLGGAYGMIITWLFPSMGMTPSAFAVAGMAGLVGGITGAAVASIVMIFEMTLDYNVIVPMTVVVAISYGMRHLLNRGSIYTMKLSRRGHNLPEALRSELNHGKPALELMVRDFGTMAATATLVDLAAAVSVHPGISCWLIHDEDRITGFLRNQVMVPSLLQEQTTARLGEIADRRFAIVQEQTTFIRVLDRLRAAGASLALVVGNDSGAFVGNVKGVITERQVAEATIRATELY